MIAKSDHDALVFAIAVLQSRELLHEMLEFGIIRRPTRDQIAAEVARLRNNGWLK